MDGVLFTVNPVIRPYDRNKKMKKCFMSNDTSYTSYTSYVLLSMVVLYQCFISFQECKAVKQQELIIIIYFSNHICLDFAVDSEQHSGQMQYALVTKSSESETHRPTNSAMQAESPLASIKGRPPSMSNRKTGTIIKSGMPVSSLNRHIF